MLKHNGLKRRRLMYSKQHDEKDCGPACLLSICAFYNQFPPLAKIRELCKTDLQGTNVFGLVQAAKALGFSATALQGDIKELQEQLADESLCLPLICHVVTEDNFDHFIVLYDVHDDVYIIEDPAFGKKTLTGEIFSSMWSGVIVSLTPASLKNAYDSTGFIKTLYLFASAQKYLVGFAVFCSLVITTIGISSAFLFQFVVDGLTKSSIDNLPEMAFWVFLAMAALYVIQMALSYARGYCLTKFSNRLDERIMMGFYCQLLDLPMDFFGSRKTGEILSRFSDASKIREAISAVTFTALIDCVLVVAGLIILTVISPVLTSVSALLFLLYLFVLAVFSHRFESFNKSLMESNAQLNSYLKETIDGIETVKTFVQESCVKATALKKFKELITESFKLSMLVVNQNILISFISSISVLFLLWFGIIQVMQSELSVGALITFCTLTQYFLTPLSNIVQLQPQIKSAYVALSRLEDITALEREELYDGDEVASLTGDISFRNINYRYGNRELVLENISFDIAQGEKVAIIGESGSGKTTLAKLLLGFYQAETGKIYLGGKEISDISKGSLRRRVSYLSQDPFLFSGTILENITFGAAEYQEAAIIEACRKAQLLELLQSLPLSLDSMVEERGVNFSGGQRQRIALARVLLTNPDILILDEATSNLDTVTERKILANIFDESNAITCLLITHRLNAIKGCDKIMLVEGGRVCEIGTHEELIDKHNRYFEYWENQGSPAEL